MTCGGASPVLQIVHHLSMRNPTPSGPMQLPATWNASAPGYAEYMVTHAAMYAERALEIVPLRPTDNVLDVAAGPGSLAFVAAPRAAHVLAVDFADGMVEQIRTRAKRDGVSNVEARVMDAQSLDLPEGSFDAAFCMFGFMFFPDRMRAFRELCRVLRPGGRALVATWAPIERRPLMKVGFDSLAEALPGLPPLTKGDLQQSDECVREMTGGGFRDVAAQVFTASMHVDSAEHYLRVMERAGGPFLALKKKLGADAWAQVEARLLDAVRRRIPEGGTDLAAEAILTVGTR